MNPALKRLIGVTLSLTFFLGAMGIFAGLIVPESSRIQELRGERDALTALLEEETARLDAVLRLFEEFGNLTALRETMELALPTEGEVPSVINQIQGAANVSGVTIDSLDINLPAIRPSSGEDFVRPLGEVEITFTLTGDYQSIKNYLNAIETNVRIMDLKNLGLQGGTESNTLSYNVVVSAYYQI